MNEQEENVPFLPELSGLGCDVCQPGGAPGLGLHHRPHPGTCMALGSLDPRLLQGKWVSPPAPWS